LSKPDDLHYLKTVCPFALPTDGAVLAQLSGVGGFLWKLEQALLGVEHGRKRALEIDPEGDYLPEVRNRKQRAALQAGVADFEQRVREALDKEHERIRAVGNDLDALAKKRFPEDPMAAALLRIEQMELRRHFETLGPDQRRALLRESTRGGQYELLEALENYPMVETLMPRWAIEEAKQIRIDREAPGLLNRLEVAHHIVDRAESAAKIARKSIERILGPDLAGVLNEPPGERITERMTDAEKLSFMAQHGRAMFEDLVDGDPVALAKVPEEIRKRNPKRPIVWDKKGPKPKESPEEAELRALLFTGNELPPAA
jgi:hypothetical protein